eukprot:CAMPEP_0197722964 /NCGR_PEP_ID=MMETSP1434-20131217/5453_1 /TAXON_ID=265543 /ORGANISM="Minutocellus polymorphus, Strain CCMP3303" /LENGTH=65 /DNA_ID=CAMNT_0043308163 /DNA_START=556 /DNA_END=749 /DNA_ORIENTATION=-
MPLPRCTRKFLNLALWWMIHYGCFLEDKRMIVGVLGDGRLGHVREVVPGAFNPVEEGVQFDALGV